MALTEVPGATKPEKSEFMELLRTHLQKADLVKLVLAKCGASFREVERVLVRPLEIRGRPHLAFVFRYPTRDETKNMPLEEGLGWLENHLGRGFQAAHLLLTDGDVHAEWGRKGRCRISRGLAEAREALMTEHNREKRRWVVPTRPWLRALGLMDREGRLVPSMAHKWKQVNRFIEVFDGAFRGESLQSRPPVRVLDFGSGKGYLTFALFDHLTQSREMNAEVVGIELRPALVDLCNRWAADLECHGLTFRIGKVAEQEVAPVDVLIALHACDTATDSAIRLGVHGMASVILCSPCCHKQIRPQLHSPDVLKPLLRFGVHEGQQAEMVTDGMRALLLEAHNYDVQVFEFISLEHTDKNKMIMATRRGPSRRSATAWAEYQAIKSYFGITTHHLEELLGPPNAQSQPGD